MSTDNNERPQKAYSCDPPFERYGAIIKYAETASKARYKALTDLYNTGFQKSQVKIMDIKVLREKELDGLANKVENMGVTEAYKKIGRLKASDKLEEAGRVASA